jgi:hypothetical protein
MCCFTVLGRSIRQRFRSNFLRRQQFTSEHNVCVPRSSSQLSRYQPAECHQSINCYQRYVHGDYYYFSIFKVAFTELGCNDQSKFDIKIIEIVAYRNQFFFFRVIPEFTVQNSQYSSAMIKIMHCPSHSCYWSKLIVGGAPEVSNMQCQPLCVARGLTFTVNKMFDLRRTVKIKKKLQDIVSPKKYSGLQYCSRM